MSVLLVDIGKIHFFPAAAAASRQVCWRWRRLRALPAVSPAVACGLLHAVFRRTRFVAI